MSPRSSMLSSTLRLKRLVLIRQRPASRQAQVSPDQGLTLLECLVAIVVIAITVATITPPIFLATATRIQSRRAEQANQIAQGEVDRIRQLVERGTYTLDQLPTDAGTGRAEEVAAASGVTPNLMLSPSSTCGNYPPIPAAPTPATSLIPVDLDGNCQPEFAMQVYRSASCIPASITATATTPPYAFEIGVRVYAYQPNQDMSNLRTDRASLALTTARGDTAGTQRRPLQVLYSRAARVNSNESLECSGGGS